MARSSLAALSLLTTLFVAPIAVRTAAYFASPSRQWWTADRSATGQLPPAVRGAAAVRVFAARAVSWRGIFAVHCWIVLKDAAAPRYDRYDLTAWGEPIRLNGFEPDGRWFGQVPQVVFAADGAQAEALVGRMRAAIAAYRFSRRGDYIAWPGPNSNTFVASVMAAVPEIRATLPPTAIGKDFPVDGRWLAPTASRTGLRLSLGGYAGASIGWVEGIEINILGGVIGLDLRRPGIKLPAVGRIGF